MLTCPGEAHTAADMPAKLRGQSLLLQRDVRLCMTCSKQPWPHAGSPTSRSLLRLCRAVSVREQVTAVPVSRQGSGVSVHELRLPSNNSVATGRMDSRFAPHPAACLGPQLRCLPMAASCPRHIIAALKCT